MQRKVWWWIGLAALLLLAVWLSSCPNGEPRSSGLLSSMMSANPISQAAESLGIQPIEIPQCGQERTGTVGRSTESLTCSGTFGLADSSQEARLLEEVKKRIQRLAEAAGFSDFPGDLPDPPGEFHLVFDRILLDIGKGRMTTTVSVRGLLIPQGGSAQETVYRFLVTADELSILWK